MNFNTRQRYMYFTIGVIFTALGISFITKAGLGTSAIASPAYVLTYLLPYSFGTLTFLFSILQIIMQILILKRKFSIIQLLQFPAGLLLGVLIDFYMFVMSGWAPTAYFMRIFVLVGGCAVLGLGVCFQVIGDVLMLPAEGLVRVLAKKFHWEFGKMKTLFDVCLVSFSILISVIFLHGLVGVREGTMIAAVTTGFFSRYFQKKFTKIMSKKSSS